MNLPFDLPPLHAGKALPPGTYLITEHTITALQKVPGAALSLPIEKGDPIGFPDHEGPWITLPNGTNLSVYEHEERLVCEHIGVGPAFAADAAILATALD